MSSNSSFATRRLRRYIQSAIAGAALGIVIVGSPAYAVPYSNHTVTTTEDNDDAGSLRNTIDSVNLDTLHSIITFSSGLGSNPVFTLNSALPSITNSYGVIFDTSNVGNVTLSQALTASNSGLIYLDADDGSAGSNGDTGNSANGPGYIANGTDGGSSSITANVILNSLSSLTVNGGGGGDGGSGGYGGYGTTTDANGGAGGDGGNSSITGDVMATDSTFTLNGGAGGAGGEGGWAGNNIDGDANGGAGGSGGDSYVQGDVTATDSTFTLTAGAGGTGGNDGDDSYGGAGNGNTGDADGGIGGAGGSSYIDGEVTATDSTFNLDAANGGNGGSGGRGGEGNHSTGDADGGVGGAGGNSYIDGDVTATNSTFNLDAANGGNGGNGSSGGLGSSSTGDADGGVGGAGGSSYIQGDVTANGSSFFNLNAGNGGNGGNGGAGYANGTGNGGISGAGGDSYIEGNVIANDSSQFILSSGNSGEGGDSNGEYATGGDGGAAGSAYINGNVTTNDDSEIDMYGASITGNVATNDDSEIYMQGASITGTLTANDNSYVDLEYGSSITGDVTTNGNSYFRVYSASNVTGNLTADNYSYISIENGSSITGNATFNDASVLYTYGNNTFNTTANTTTTFGANATFAPQLNLVQNGSDTFSSPGSPDTSNVLTVNNLTLNNSKLQPVWNDEGNIIPLNQTFDVIHYNGTLSGATVWTVVSPFTFDTSYTGTSGADMLLTLTGVDYTQLGGGGNQRSLENYLNHFYSIEADGYGGASAINLDPDGKLEPGINLAQLTAALSDEGASGLDYLIPGAYSQHNTQTYWSNAAFINSIADNLRNGNNIGNGGESSFALNQTNVGNAGMQLASLRQAMTFRPDGLGISSNTGGSSNGVWAGYTGAHQHTDADSGIGSNDWSSSSDGFTLGYTGGGDRFNWGIAAGHQKSTFESVDSSGDQEGYNAGLYASWKSKNIYLNAVLGYGNYDNSVYDTPEIDPDFKTHGLSAYLELGKRLKDDSKGGLSPYASLLWTRVKNDSASDTNSGFNLESGTDNVYTTALGLRYNHRMFDKNDMLKGGWTAGLAWMHQFGDTAFPVNGAYTNGEPYSFQIESTPLSGDAAQVQLGAYGRIHGNLIGFAGYQGTFGSNQNINAVNAGVGYQF
jgi:hypothetical protein